MAYRGAPRPEPEPGTYARIRRDLEIAEAAVVKILEAAPRARSKYPDVGRAGRAVLDALTKALREHSTVEGVWLRYKKEREGGGR